nr:zinc finger, CCHC-type [Tanacetum cinerariifolium]
MLKHESMEYRMKKVFGLRWNCKELKGIIKLRFFRVQKEAAFAVADVEKVYTHESLTFNYTVSCEVISKWKARLKEDMNVQSDVYVLSNGYKKSSDDNHDYFWEYAPVQDSQQKVGTDFVEGAFTLSLEDSLSGDYDVKKNGSLKANLQHMEVLSTTEA